MKTSEIMAALAERYSGQEWAFMPQVRAETGAAACQTADGMAFNLWPSRGLEVIGFEVKASRSDWQRELKMPNKAEGIFAKCDRWYLVIGDVSIVKPGEIPSTWGLIVPKGNGLVIKVEAPRLKSKPMDRENICAIMRKAKELVAPKMPRVSELHSAEAIHHRELGRADMKGQIDRLTQDRDLHRKAIDDFQAASGVHIDRWCAGTIGDAVALIRDRPRLDVLAMRVESCLKELRTITENVGNSAARIRAVVEGKEPEPNAPTKAKDDEIITRREAKAIIEVRNSAKVGDGRRRR